MIFFMVVVMHQLETPGFGEINSSHTSIHKKGEIQRQVATTGFMEVIISTRKILLEEVTMMLSMLVTIYKQFRYSVTTTVLIWH